MIHTDTAPFFTTTELADLFRVSRKTIRAWRRHGKLPGVRIGRDLRFKPADVARLCQHGGKEPSM